MWYEAVAFCNWLSEQLVDVLLEDHAVRLPTEAEWEVAAAYDQHGQRRTYPWGDQAPTSEYAIYDELQLEAAAPVGCCPAGVAACGALDMAGNVWEWASSDYLAYPQQADIEMEDFTRNIFAVPLRGGSWRKNSTYVRCWAQYNNDPNHSLVSYGFRIVVALKLAR